MTPRIRELQALALDLAGDLLIDGESRAAAATDAGGLISRSPCAVLRPKSTDDIVRTLQLCRRHGIKVLARGQGHTTFGQAQVADGVVVDMRSLDEIHSVAADRAVVDAGATWRRLLEETLPQRRTPPVLTGFQGLTVGGTLSVGGLSGVAYNKGAQVDHVIELEVVTGDGDVVTCSGERNADLFEAVLAGLGRSGIIARATLQLVEAPDRVRQAVLGYATLSPMLRDIRALAHRGSLDGVSATLHLGPHGDNRYELNGLSFFTPPTRPDTTALLGEVGAEALLEISDLDYRDYYLTVDRLLDDLRASGGGWDGVMHPWLDVFLPDAQIERYIAETLSLLDPASDVGPAGLGALGQIHLFPIWSRFLRRPLLRVPEGELVFLFDILTSAHRPGRDATYARRMIERNRRLFERARDLGGTRYNIAAVPFSVDDWNRQIGPTGAAFKRQQLARDPDRVWAPFA